MLGSDLELPTLLAKLVALAEQALGAELSSVMLLDERRAGLHWEVADGGVATGVLRQMTVAVGEGIAGTVAATGEPIVVTDAEHGPAGGPARGRRHRLPHPLDRVRADPLPRHRDRGHPGPQQAGGDVHRRRTARCSS